jgi:hypothetical protein
MKKKYTVEQRVVTVDYYSVYADSEEEAKDLVANEKGDLVYTEFSHVLEDEPLVATEDEDEDGN